MKIYHWFVPNKKNKFHPVALRSTGLIVFLALFIAIPLSYNVISVRQFMVLGYATDVNIADLYSLSNQERANAGLAPLSLNSQLNSAALAKANDMFADNYWAHVAPDGVTPWSFILSAGYQYASAGENLAKDFNTSSGVVSGWMGSSTHKANVLSASYVDVGYAVVNGSLLGSETSLVVAMYGSKSAPVAASTSPATKSPASPVAAAPKAPSNQQNTQPTAVTETPSPVVTTAPQVKSDQQGVQSTEQIAVRSGDTAGSVEGLSVSVPLKVYTSFNWGQKASILLICTLILLFLMKHTLIWREQKRGLKHIWMRSHPLAQMVILVMALAITIASGAGVVL